MVSRLVPWLWMRWVMLLAAPRPIPIVISTAISPAVDWLYRYKVPRAIGVVLIYLLLFAAIFGAEWLVSNMNSDELSNMGVEKKS